MSYRSSAGTAEEKINVSPAPDALQIIQASYSPYADASTKKSLQRQAVKAGKELSTTNKLPYFTPYYFADEIEKRSDIWIVIYNAGTSFRSLERKLVHSKFILCPRKCLVPIKHFQKCSFLRAIW